MRLAGTSPTLRVVKALAAACLPPPVDADIANGCWVWKEGGILRRPHDPAVFQCVILWADGTSQVLDLRLPDEIKDFEDFLDNLKEATA